jgi:DNA-binding LacI/PurR family transcriptional regulator
LKADGGMTKAEFQKTATLADVARAAGVSKGTASNVFNRPDIVREEVRQRVRETAVALGYKGPDPRGRLLSAGKVNAIGVATIEPLSNFFEDPFARVLMTRISEACDENGTGISLVSAANEEDLAWNMRSAVVDGFILFCLSGANRLVELSRERNLPFVALDFGDGDETMSAIDVDNVDGARQAARHLADLGHTRFAILTMEFDESGGYGRTDWERALAASYSAPRERVNGYRLEFDARGVAPEDVMIFETQSDRHTVEAVLEDLFSLPSPPTAILAQSDKIALLAMKWLARRGTSVPDDVSIVGFDGVPESETCIPALTTIQQPIGDIGRYAVKAILDHPGEIWRKRLKAELVVRGSTARPGRSAA